MFVGFFKAWRFSLCDRGGDGGGFALHYLVAEVGDLKLVLDGDDCFVDALAVEVDAVGAAQVANDELVVKLNDAAVSPRDLFGLDADIAVRVATDENNRSVQRNQRTFAYRFQTNRHSTLSALRPAGFRGPALLSH